MCPTALNRRIPPVLPLAYETFFSGLLSLIYLLYVCYYYWESLARFANYQNIYFDYFGCFQYQRSGLFKMVLVISIHLYIFCEFCLLSVFIQWGVSTTSWMSILGPARKRTFSRRCTLLYWVYFLTAFNIHSSLRLLSLLHILLNYHSTSYWKYTLDTSDS